MDGMMIDTKGRYKKFDVRRTDGRDSHSDKHYGCDYFVLDLTHDPHALTALMVYAIVCREDRPRLSNDICSKYFVAGKAVGDPTEKPEGEGSGSKEILVSVDQWLTQNIANAAKTPSKSASLTVEALKNLQKAWFGKG